MGRAPRADARNTLTSQKVSLSRSGWRHLPHSRTWGEPKLHPPDEFRAVREQVVASDADDAPALVLELLAPPDITSESATVGAVLVALVLEEEPRCPVDEVTL